MGQSAPEASRKHSVQDVGARVEELLATLRSSRVQDPAPVAEELVRLLVGLYGDGQKLEKVHSPMTVTLST